MVKRLSKQEFFSLILVLILIFVNSAVLNMLIPSYGVIVDEFGIDQSLVTLPDSLFVLVAAGCALVWGYYTDKLDRARVIMIGAFFWVVGSLLTAFDYSFAQLILARMVTGAGMGVVLPVGMSIISDIVPEEERSGYLGGVAILSSISNAAGNALSAFLGPLNILGMGWRFPFFFVAIMALIVVVLLAFIKIPKRGAVERELKSLQDLQLEYQYTINRRDLIDIMKKRTNRYLFIQGFFAIIPGTILIHYLILLFRNSMFVGLPDKISLQTATIFAGMVGVGYLIGNVVLSYLGDVLFKKNKRNRVLLGTISMFATIPLCLIMLLSISPIDASVVLADLNIPVDGDGNYLIPDEEVMTYVIGAVGSIFNHYPNYGVFFAFSLIGSFMSAGAVANRNATVLDVNLPEQRGTASSIFSLSEQIGKGVTLLLAGGLIALLGSTYNMMLVSVLFWLPAGILWALALRHVVKEMDERSVILAERKQMTIIDYVFELEFNIDGALQKIHDAKYFLNSNVMRAEDLLEDAHTILTKINELATERGLEDTAVRALSLKIKTEKLLNHFRKIVSKKREGEGAQDLASDMAQLQLEIDEFPKSDINKTEILYDSGFLKVVEARLERKHDYLRAVNILNQAVHVFDRVERLVQERMSSMEEDHPDYQRLNYLLTKSANSKFNTQKLLKGMEKILKRIQDEGIDLESLSRFSELSAEYGVNLKEIIDETLGEEKARAFKEIGAEIDTLFKQYDAWEQEHPRYIQL